MRRPTSCRADSMSPSARTRIADRTARASCRGSPRACSWAGPIVPRLSWVWVIVFFVFLVSLALTLLFMDTVRRCADTIAAKPFTTFLVGLLVLLLTGPVSIILAASVIGILVVPFVLCAVVVAWIIGKVGVSVRLGDSMVGQTLSGEPAAVGPIASPSDSRPSA